MAPIAAETSFRTLCIPADCSTISLYPFPIVFTQPTPTNDLLQPAVVDAVDDTLVLPQAHRPPHPFPPCLEDFPLSATLVRPLSAATAHLSAPPSLLPSTSTPTHGTTVAAEIPIDDEVSIATSPSSFPPAPVPSPSPLPAAEPSLSAISVHPSRAAPAPFNAPLSTIDEPSSTSPPCYLTFPPTPTLSLPALSNPPARLTQPRDF
eukprot:scaffold4604_cov86-Amphora_coffeaeformis.AAC.1